MSMQSDYDILQDRITELLQEHKRRNGAIDSMYLRAIERDVLAMVDAGLVNADDINALILDLERSLGKLTDNIAVQVLERAKDLIKVQQYFWMEYGYSLDSAKEYERLQAIQANAYDEFAGIPKTTGELIRQMLSDNEIMGKGKDTVVDEIRRIAGVSSARARLIAGTSEFLYIGQFNANRAEDLGVGTWEYKPDFVIETSRPFSRWAVMRRYFTKAEVEAIDNREWEKVPGIPLDETGEGWQGQIPGVPVLVQGGGYNTIHRFAMVFSSEEQESSAYSKYDRMKFPEEEDSIRSNSYETMLVFDNDGNEIYRIKGEKYRVSVSASMADKLKGKIVSHNHPSGSSFSAQDVLVAKGYQFQEIRVCTKNTNYSISLTEKGRSVDMKKFQMEVKRSELRTRVQIKQMAEAGEITREKAELEYRDMVWKNFAEKGYVNYNKTDII